MSEVCAHPPLSDAEFAALLGAVGVSPSTDFAVAVSGGADSLALAVLLRRWQQASPGSGRGIALTVDHGLRPESAAEAAQVAAWLEEMGMLHVTLRWMPAKRPHTGLLAAAREARYALLSEWCAAHQISTLFLAHHQQDQVETFWMRLEHASGLDGLGGMRSIVNQGTLTVVRPILSIPKVRLQATLQAMGHPWIEDPTNQNLNYRRPQLRAAHKTWTAIGIEDTAISDTMSKLQAEAEALSWVANAFLAMHAQKDGNHWRMPLAPLQALPDALIARVIQTVIRAIHPGGYPLRHARVMQLTRTIKGSFKRTTLGGCLWQVKTGILTVLPEKR